MIMTVTMTLNVPKVSLMVVVRTSLASACVIVVLHDLEQWHEKDPSRVDIGREHAEGVECADKDCVTVRDAAVDMLGKCTCGLIYFPGIGIQSKKIKNKNQSFVLHC